ncbi:MAG: chloride channel protein [Fusobacteriaceae bacterium]|jgi:H+/Cl- antiporter ClcA|nr:chloride channel protein [Fusobacteriaceae bacterium]
MHDKGNVNENTIQASNGSLFILSLLVGIITGLIVSFYRWGLNLINHFREKIISNTDLYNIKFMVIILVVFIIIGLILSYIGDKFPGITGSGIPQVKGVLLRTIRYVNWPIELFLKFITGIFGIGCGLSLGREGPSVQLGSYIGYGVTKLFKKNEIDGKYLITCGSSAGLAGAFGSPLAGIVFSFEEFHKVITSKLLISTFISSVAADFVGRRIFGMQTAFDIAATYPKHINQYFHLIFIILFGIIIAIFGKIFTITLIKSKDIFKNTKINKNIKITFIMLISFILCFVLPEVTGGGHGLVESLVTSKESLIFLVIILIIKFLFTTLSYSTGFAGGIFLPMLVIGAIFGKIYGIILMNIFPEWGIQTPHFMVLGMIAFFVSVVRAPITGIVLILEMTGTFEHLLALAVISIVAYYVTDILKLEPIYDILYDKMEKSQIPIDTLPNKELIEVVVTKDFHLNGKIISEIKWVKDILIVTLVRNGRKVIITGDTRIIEDDIVTILSSKNDFLNMDKVEYF